MTKQFLLLWILTGALVLPRPVTAQNPPGAKPTQAKPAQAKSAETQPVTAGTGLAGTITDTAIHFADSIFHQPNFLYEEVETGIPPDIQPILLRFNNALVANRQWFEEYKNTYAGQPLPYNQRFGISAGEYRRLQSFTPQLVPVDTQKVNVVHEAGYIRFHGVDSSFQLLDYMQIDLKNQLLVYGADTIPLVGRTSAPASSPYGEWQGFTWRLEKADAAGTLASSRVTARVIEINMGLTAPGSSPSIAQPAAPSIAQPAAPPSGQPTASPQRVFLRVKYQQMQEGNTTANLEMVGYVQH